MGKDAYLILTNLMTGTKCEEIFLYFNVVYFKSAILVICRYNYINMGDLQLRGTMGNCKQGKVMLNHTHTHILHNFLLNVYYYLRYIS